MNENEWNNRYDGDEGVEKEVKYEKQKNGKKSENLHLGVMPFCTSLGAVFEADENKYESRRPKIILDRFHVHKKTKQVQQYKVYTDKWKKKKKPENKWEMEIAKKEWAQDTYTDYTKSHNY